MIFLNFSPLPDSHAVLGPVPIVWRRTEGARPSPVLRGAPPRWYLESSSAKNYFHQEDQQTLQIRVFSPLERQIQNILLHTTVPSPAK